jgi:Large polyvalent protein associated domain 23
MAKYRVTGPDGNKYDITAPDDMSMDDALARFKSEYKGADPSASSGLTSTGRTAVMATDGITLGYDKRLFAAYDALKADPKGALTNAVGGIINAGLVVSGRDALPDGDGNEASKVYEAKKKEYNATYAAAEKEATFGEKATAFGAGMLVPLPFVKMKSGVDGFKQAAKIGGLMGAVHGSSRGEDWDERATNAASGGGLGAVGAPLLKIGFDGVARAANTVIEPIRRGMTQRANERATERAAIGNDFTAAGVEPFTPALLLSPLLQRVTASTGASVPGQPIMSAARRTINDIEEGARAAVRGPSGGMPNAATTGTRAQDVLREQIVEHSIPRGQVSPGIVRDPVAYTNPNVPYTPSPQRPRGPTEPLGPRQDSYPTQFEGAYTAAADRLAAPGAPTATGSTYTNPRFAPVTMSSRLHPDANGQPGPTDTMKFVFEMADQARTSGFMSGWKGDMSDPRVWQLVNEQLGPRITGWLQHQNLLGSRNNSSMSIDGINQFKQIVGREIGDALKTYPGAPPSGDERALRGLYSALKSDMEKVMTRAGHGEAANAYRNVDRAYRDEFVPIRSALRRMYGQDVAPEQAVAHITKSMQRGDVGNAATVRQFFDVIRRDGAPNGTPGRPSESAHLEVVRGLLAPAAENGIGGMRKFMESISPQARSEMMNGPGRQVVLNLERLLAAEARMQPFMRMNGSRPIGDINISSAQNAGHAAVGFMSGGTSLIASAVGGYGFSRLMTSPQFTNWLLRAPQAARNGYDAPQWNRHAVILASMTGIDRDTARTAFDAIKSGFGVTPANATFAGEGAADIDRGVLAKAKTMHADGADRDAIWKETGWFKQPDGKWRLELDDSAAKLNDKFSEFMARGKADPNNETSTRLGDILDHPELFQRYPNLAGIAVYAGRMPKGHEGTAAFVYNRDKAPFMMLNADKGVDGKMVDLPVLLHEVQHLIQGREGFAYGKFPKKGVASMKMADYGRMPGEYEADNVYYRADMTAGDRKELPPWRYGINVPDDEVTWKGAKTVQGRAVTPRRASAPGPSAKTDSTTPDLFTSLEAAPSVIEVRKAIGSGTKHFDFDVRNADPEAIAEIKKAGGRITAYHVGGGGGREWKGLSPDEQVNKFDTPEALNKLTADVKGLVAKGADSIHFDNTHRMSGKKLEQIADAIKQGGAGFVAKNNADKWTLVMRRRPDLKPDYAVIEAAMHDADETQAAADIAHRGVPTYIIGFKTPLNPKTPAVSPEYAKDYAAANPWAHVILMENEKAYEGRGATHFKPKR